MERVTLILAAQSTRSNWPNKEFQALKTWDLEDPYTEVDGALYYPVFKISTIVKVL